MFRHLIVTLAALTAVGSTANCQPGRPAPASRPDSARLKADVDVLAADSLEGRATGTRGNTAAAAFIARRYETLGLTPVVIRENAATCAANGAADGCEPGFLQPFTAHSMAAAHAGRPSEFPTQNVVAVIPGSDPALRNEYVVLGAHFDHLGRSTDGALDPDKTSAVRLGADDNASGTAVVMELARLLRAHPIRRSVVVANFSGEEMGLLGSQWFVEHSPVPLGSVQAMLNFDMVGRLRASKLLVYGVASATELGALVDSVNRSSAAPLSIVAQGDGFGPSDHSSFYGKNVPVLHFFTDLHDDYHRASDVSSKIDAGGMARVAALAEGIVRSIGDRPSRLSFVKAAAPPSMSGSREGSNVYLGSIPDMGAAGVKGVRLSGVRAASPADLAGMKEGDVIVDFDGKPVKDLYEYSSALYSHKAGDVVKIAVMRGAERLTLTVTLGKRGG